MAVTGREPLRVDSSHISSTDTMGRHRPVVGDHSRRTPADTIIGSAACPESLLVRLVAARNALLQSQEGLAPNSASWKAIQSLVRDIDVLATSIAAGETRSMLFNLNADSDSPVKGRTSGRRQGVLHGWRTEAGQMKRSLDEFAAEIRDKGRIGKYDVQTLQHTLLKDGLASRAEADLLIALDREVDSVHFSWPAFFISALTEFAVWNSGRPGYIDEEKSMWLLPLLMGEGATDRGRRALAAIAREAECFDEAFFAQSPSKPIHPPRNPAFQELSLAA
jgi:hypothetical protein